MFISRGARLSRALYFLRSRNRYFGYLTVYNDKHFTDCALTLQLPEEATCPHTFSNSMLFTSASFAQKRTGFAGFFTS
jgi:hypothetical protein